MPNKGIFIVLEGSDGSGKGTQFKLLSERLKAVGYDVEVFDFPRYDEPSSHFVKKYLNGEYGDAAKISPYTASLFFALDRYEAAPKIKEALGQGKVVLSNRYVGSNMAHQGGKFTNSGEQRGFFIWEDGLEFQLLGIPRPTINIFLRVPAEVSFDLIAKKEKRSYTDNVHDEHEGNLEHLKSSVATYDTLCKLFPKDFESIECAPDGKLMSIADINNKIWKAIKPVLPQVPPNKGRNVVVQLNNSEEKAEKKEIAKVPRELKSTEKLSGEESPAELKITIKKVTMLAANHVQAIAGIKSELISTQWPADGSYNFYTPVDLPKKLIPVYKSSLELIANLHKQINAESDKTSNVKLAAKLNSLMPLAALTTLKITGGDSAIARLISQLRQSPFSELKWLAEQVQVAATQLRPAVFSAAKSEKNILKTQNDALFEIASKKLGSNIPPRTDKISLQEALPKNEFALLVDALFPYSSSSRSEIAAELETWSYSQKNEALAAALRSENSPVLEEARYRWDVVEQIEVFNPLKEAMRLDELQSQASTPKYGYDVPEEVEDAALEEIYIECFEQSKKLFIALQENGQAHLAEYAVLAGNKNRWQFTTSAKTLKLAYAQNNEKTAQRILETMVEKISERHPLIGEYISLPPELPQAEEKPPENKLSLPKKISAHRRRRSRKPKK
jgi:dTMP kinase